MADLPGDDAEHHPHHDPGGQSAHPGLHRPGATVIVSILRMMDSPRRHFSVRGVRRSSACDANQDIFSQRVRFGPEARSEEHTSELQSLMRTSYAVFCLKKKKKQ